MNDVFGQDRPERGSVLHVVLDGVPLTSTAGASSEQSLVAEVPMTRTGRRSRVALGAELQVSWGSRGKVRTRSYRVADVVVSDSGRPDWHLVPLAPAAEGTRRAVPRYTVALPAVLVAADVRLVGQTVDISVAGVRLSFPAGPPATHPLPAPGDTGQLAVLLDEVRTAVPAVVVRSGLLPDGTRDVRVYLTGELDEDRRRLRDYILAAAPEDDVPAGPLPGTDQPKDEPVSAS
ncbi:PilZ domain-containing protein [Klenkia soli]|uniref:PilZ domain-containing protein n=1 Tax=Klenkia soli TaxID=1052260 RepID=A0A1H0TI67_9ACTN|nr:PilZ domain-containing protein [Klenkia soli]SDP53531.1 PilZ domain-containing protein [Klenkia soli]